MEIRVANEADILKVSELWLRMVYELTPNETPNLQWWCERLNMLMKLRNYCMQIVEDEGNVLGFIDYMIFPEPSTSKIHGVGQTFYVLPKYRSTNVSGKLWKSAVKHLKKEGVQVLEVICADQQKPFWQKHGFEFKYSFMKRKKV